MTIEVFAGVSGETLIATTTGFTTVAELAARGSGVQTLYGGREESGAKLVSYARAVEAGRGRVLRLVTKEGYTLRAGQDHQVLALKRGAPNDHSGHISRRHTDECSEPRTLGMLERGDRLLLYNRPLSFGISGSVAQGMTLAEALMSQPDFSRVAEHMLYIREQLLRKNDKETLLAGDLGRDRGGPGDIWDDLYDLSEGRHSSALSPPLHNSTRGMQEGFLKTIFASPGARFEAGGGETMAISGPRHLLVMAQTCLLSFRVFAAVDFARQQLELRSSNLRRAYQFGLFDASHMADSLSYLLEDSACDEEDFIATVEAVVAGTEESLFVLAALGGEQLIASEPYVANGFLAQQGGHSLA